MSSFQQPYPRFVYYALIPLLFVYFLLGCNSSRVANANIPNLMSQPGDFPAQLQPNPPQPLPTDMINNGVGYIQELKTVQAVTAGEVRLYLFYNLDDQNSTYDYFTQVESQEGIVPYEAPAVGEDRAARQTDNTITLVFRRCSAVAVIDLYDVKPYQLKGSDITRYAERLDKRLQPVACQ